MFTTPFYPCKFSPDLKMHVNFNETLKWELEGTNKCELLVGIVTFFSNLQ